MKQNRVINNKYRIERLIGKGGVASVFLARDIMLNKFVAVKKIHEEYARDAKFVDMFCQEAVNTARLEHENIVRVLNFVNEDDDYYMIMEYVRGVDLEYLLRKCKKRKISFPAEIAVYIISEVIKALDYAHNIKDELTGNPVNIVHRDISPGNVMLYYSGKIKLADFGIARAGTKKQEDNKIKGKVSYMSPEHARAKNVDARSDLYCCGLVLYEMIAGQKPYKGKGDLDIWMKAKNAKVDIKSLFKEGNIEKDVIKIIEKSLKKKQSQRYQNAAEMFIDMKKYLSRKATTLEMEKKYCRFINAALREEIINSEKDIRKMAENKQEIIKTVSEKEKPEDNKKEESNSDEHPEERIQQKKPVKAEVKKDEKGKVKPEAEKEKADKGEGESKEKDKTVLDFVIDSAKKYKKAILSSLIAAAAAFILFAVIDTFAQLTPLGAGIYNRFWPPALNIDTEPSGAEIKIIDENNIDIIEREGFDELTPSSIEVIPPGTYTLEISKENYGRMRRIITVSGREKGRQQVSVAGARLEDGVHIVPFEIGMEIDSVPSGSELFINGTGVGRTPFSGKLETGMHSLYLSQEGFESLGSRSETEVMQPGLCVIDTSKPARDQSLVDRRFWTVNEIEDAPGKAYQIKGTLWKYVSIFSEPEGALAVITDIETDEPVHTGQTPLEDIMLAVGEYSLGLEKSGFESRRENLVIDDRSDDSMRFMLNRYVTVHALDRETGENLNADIRISNPVISTIRGKTPIRAALPLENTRFYLSKEPAYETVDVTRDVGQLGGRYNVRMSLRPPHLSMSIRDFKSGETVEDATVWINGSYWKSAGRRGRAAGHIDQPPAEYRVEVRADGYTVFRESVSISKGQRKEMDIGLKEAWEGSVELEIPEEYMDSAVNLNGESIGLEASLIGERLHMGENTLYLILPRREERLKLSFSLSGQVKDLIIKLEEKDDEMHLTAFKE